LVICLVLLVPIVPFLFFGEQVDQWVARWRGQDYSTPVTAAVIAGLLASDIFLPVPSSVLSTFGGYHLGPYVGTLVSWTGMTLGAVAGFWLARRFGYSFALWFTTASQLERMTAASEKFGPWLLVLVRGVPVLAEASVLLVGINRISWSRFLPPVMLANLGLALAYSVFGEQADQHQMLPLAMGVAIALPVLLGIVAASWLPGQRANETSRSETDVR
jgi:uncharacterized membrane protein YdjX (TVP38/TMEM64 family)